MKTSRHTSTQASRGFRMLRGGFFGSVALLGLLLAACGTTSTTGGTGGNATSAVPTSTVTCPTNTASFHLVSTGKLTIASDTTYAPAEFADPNDQTKYIGYDMDLAAELARRLCLTVNVQKADFGTIIPDLSGPSLGTQRYDMSISSFTINDDRLKKVDMIPYFQAGESLLVPKGNPANIKAFADMCGKTIAVQDNTVEKAELEDANGTGDRSSGQAPVCKDKLIKELHYADQTVVVAQVVSGNADASYQDSPVTGYYVKLNSAKVELGPTTVAPAPQGIVVRKDNPDLENAIKTALQNMRTDGTYLRILKNWGVDSEAYPPQ
ncbi:MAG: ABC transporter substrate-binding protein [Ktedonobacterales bacterium]